jgi:hypothetical protein
LDDTRGQLTIIYLPSEKRSQVKLAKGAVGFFATPTATLISSVLAPSLRTARKRESEQLSLLLVLYMLPVGESNSDLPRSLMTSEHTSRYTNRNCREGRCRRRMVVVGDVFGGSGLREGMIGVIHNLREQVGRQCRSPLGMQRVLLAYSAMHVTRIQVTARGRQDGVVGCCGSSLS